MHLIQYDFRRDAPERNRCSNHFILSLIEKYPEELTKHGQYLLERAIIHKKSEHIVIKLIEMAPRGQALLKGGQSFFKILRMAMKLWRSEDGKVLHKRMQYKQSDKAILKILEFAPETFVQEFLDTTGTQKSFVEMYEPSNDVLFKLNQLFLVANNNNKQHQ